MSVRLIDSFGYIRYFALSKLFPSGLLLVSCRIEPDEEVCRMLTVGIDIGSINTKMAMMGSGKLLHASGQIRIIYWLRKG